jgi:hypothetical protein
VSPRRTRSPVVGPNSSAYSRREMRRPMLSPSRR